MRLVLATRNAHKLAELSRLLPGVELVGLPEEVALPPEDGDSYAANALIKARTAAQATGSAAIADDSGIEAAVLGGRPGLHSARYAGPNATDAQNLARFRVQVAPGSRLRYVCVLAHVDPAGEEHLFEGEAIGAMSLEARGSGGFGYDPIFLPVAVPDGRTMAELSEAEKDAVSHRGHAARALLAWLAR